MHGKKLVLKLKNKKIFTLILVIFILASITSCSNEESAFIKKEVNSQINVFGVQIYMDEPKVHEAVGSKGEKAMCIYGYEYVYADELVNIGFNSDTEKVRRVTTKNPDTSIYGVVPGIKLEEAFKILNSQGFEKSDSSEVMLYKENIRITLVSMKNTHADGVILEINPE